MEYIKISLNKLKNYIQPIYRQGPEYSLKTSSDNMYNLWEFIDSTPCYINPWKTEILEAMQKNKEYSLSFNDCESKIKTIGINRVLLYNSEYNNAKIELPFDNLSNLTKKFFEVDKDKIKELLITYENEVFEMSIKYKDGKEERFKFESEYKEINKTKK